MNAIFSLRTIGQLAAVITVIGFTATSYFSTLPKDHESDAALSLIGTWRVDLRPALDAEPYYQPMVIEDVVDGSVVGSFYGSSMENGLINTKWDGVYIAFETRDASSRYVTTGRLLNGVIEGSTYSPDREMLQPWHAERTQQKPE
jgi:hypothetical protein